MSRRGLRVAVAGATGALGRELLAVLEERRFPVAELLPFATDRSTGREVEFLSEALSVESHPPPLRGVDVLFLCTPQPAALELVRAALRAEIFCVDCSGALVASAEVPLLVHELSGAGASQGVPVATAPAGPALGWALALKAIDRSAGLRRVVGTILQSAASAGRPGIDALSSETVALLGQREMPELGAFPTPVAFDCVPTGDTHAPEAAGASTSEARLAGDLERFFEPGPDRSSALEIAVTVVQVPTFVGDGSALCVETERPLSPDEAVAVLDKAPGVEVWRGDGVGPTTRDTAGRDVVLAGRLRRDPSRGNGLLLWLAADALRLSASNAVKIAESRLLLN